MVREPVNIDKGYEKYLLYKRGIPVIYGQAGQNLYGTIDAAKNYYDMFSRYLSEELGYKLNTYDQCIANKMINNKLCIIIWWVDDLCISHINSKVVDNVIAKLKKRFGQVPGFMFYDAQ